MNHDYFNKISCPKAFIAAAFLLVVTKLKLWNFRLIFYESWLTILTLSTFFSGKTILIFPNQQGSNEKQDDQLKFRKPEPNLSTVEWIGIVCSGH